ncbi:MAG: site-specific DNA-methyltransferase [Candidatus Marinimicrobia bacterium CG08_land_8_20_14_0_20_45_22]|nr:MAG: site-specific DNA-methyltransferase [Candidatus Marinimicrobia bacterium CG08_land_8_20_14_0_20_45_22]
MPTLQFKGKNIIWNHHLSVPYHTLEEVDELNFQPEKANGNLIVEGDNLLALKALLPHYAGKVKCIFIDPLYNTGNDVEEGKSWVYSDNVNSPLLKEWFGKEVSRDDLTRHDKWLCMMVPRLKLLRELLHDDGAIFITIDDNEYASLKAIMDEIFNEENLVANIVWQARKSVQNDTDISVNHNYVLVYAKNRRQTERRLKASNADKWYQMPGFVFKPLLLDKSKFSNPDNDPRGLWKADPFDAPNVRENLTYPIINPSTGKKYLPPKGRHWRTEEDNFKKLLKENRVLFGRKGESGPQLKVFWDEKKEYGEIETSWWGEGSAEIYLNEDIDYDTAQEWTNYGTTTQGSKLLQSMFNSEKVFNNPKPVELLINIIRQSANRDDIILDSFAGSGTTMHAVMELNKEDGGQRQCIMVQMTEATPKEPDKNICKDVTRERVKRAIEKYGYDSGFWYLRVGIPIDAETMLAGELPTYNQFAEYVYYLCTGDSLKEKQAINEKTYYVGKQGSSVIYLVYKQNFEELTHMALNLDLAEEISARHPQKRLIIYAPACFLEEEYMRDKSIEYVGIPYNLFRRAGE